jgi:hypothetical protein
MDLVVHDPGKPNHLYDLVITNNPKTQEVLQSSKVNLQATAVMQRIKERQYKELATEAGMLLHGAAVEVYGKWGDDFTDMFNHFVTQGSAASNCSTRSSPINGVGEYRCARRVEWRTQSIREQVG